MNYIQPLVAVAILGMGVGAGPADAADQTYSSGAKKSEQSKQDLTGGLGLTNRAGAGGGMGEETTPAGSPEGPRGLPPGKAPG